MRLPSPVFLLVGMAVLTSSAPAAPATRRAPGGAGRRIASRPAPRVAPAPARKAYTEAEARQAVAMLDDAYQIILHETHRAYPTLPGRPVAATVVRDVQKVMADRGWPQSRFLAVNALLMNPDHRAKDEFERQAIAALKTVERPMEQVQAGTLRAVTPLALGGNCSSCHWVSSGSAARAAITWSVPLKRD